MKTPARILALILVTLFLSVATAPWHGDASAATPQVVIDADPGTAGIQNTRDVATTFDIAVVVSDVDDLEAFNFEVTYDQTRFRSSTIAIGSDLDRNPDANQTFLTSTGRIWYCSPPAPVGDNDPSPTVGAAFISCYSTGATAGPNTGSGSVIATVRFSANTAGTASFGLRNVNLFKAGSVETGSCNPVVITPATCTGASVTASVAVGGIAELPDPNEASRAAEPVEQSSDPEARIAFAAVVIAVMGTAAGGWVWRRQRRRVKSQS